MAAIQEIFHPSSEAALLAAKRRVREIHGYLNRRDCRGAFYYEVLIGSSVIERHYPSHTPQPIERTIRYFGPQAHLCDGL